MDAPTLPTPDPQPADDDSVVVRHCHADGAGPCLAVDCPIAGLGSLRGHLRPCPGALGPQHPAERRP